MPTDPNSATNIVNAVLKILRGQRDDKSLQHLAGTYSLNPQVFVTGNHYIVGPIMFKSPFQRPPSIVFGQAAQQVTQQTTTTSIASGYTPLIVHAYVYSFYQAAGSISGFYMGLYALSPVPPSNTLYTISWMAEGKGTPYPQQQIGEAWTSSYNKNKADYLVNTTGVDNQS